MIYRPASMKSAYAIVTKRGARDAMALGPISARSQVKMVKAPSEKPGLGFDLDQNPQYGSTEVLSVAERNSETPMRRLLFIGLFALVFGTNIVHAARYCLQGGHWGYPGSCHFSSYEQCVASASGTNAHCGINPRYAHHRALGPLKLSA